MRFYRFLKHALTATNIGRRIDFAFRYLFSLLPLAHSLLAASRDNEGIDKFVVFLYGGIGDCVMRFRMIQILASCRPVLVVIPNYAAALLPSDHNRIVKISYNKDQEALSTIAKRVRDQGIDRALYVFTSAIAEVYLVFLILRCRCGFGYIGMHSSYRGIGISIPGEMRSDANKHKSFLRMATLLTNQLCETRATPSLAEYFPQHSSGMATLTYFIVNPNKTGTWPAGRWKADRFVALIDQLTERFDCPVYLVGSANEADYVSSIADACRSQALVRNLAGKTSLKDLGDLVANSSLVITTDSGIMHMAAYSEVKCIALFTFSDPTVYSWGKNTVAVFKPKFTCMPCVSFSLYPVDNYPVICPFNSRCNETISVNEVMQEIVSLIGHIDQHRR